MVTIQDGGSLLESRVDDHEVKKQRKKKPFYLQYLDSARVNIRSWKRFRKVRLTAHLKYGNFDTVLNHDLIWRQQFPGPNLESNRWYEVRSSKKHCSKEQSFEKQSTKELSSKNWYFKNTHWKHNSSKCSPPNYSSWKETTLKYNPSKNSHAKHIALQRI